MDNQLKEHFNIKYIDINYWGIFILLLVVSVVSLFSASSTLVRIATMQGLSPLNPILKQVGLLLIGVLFAFFIQFIPSKYYTYFGYAMLLAGVICLTLNAMHKGIQANGAYRWVSILGFSVQSSELGKIGLIVACATLLSKINDQRTELIYFIACMVLTILVCGLTLLGNLSTAILLGSVIMILMILAHIPWKWIIGIILIAFAILAGGYLYIEKTYIQPEIHMPKGHPLARAETWCKRIDNKFFVKKKQDEQGNHKLVINDDNYQAILAQMAVARGGRTPLGVGLGHSVERDHLPLAYMDYIFAIIVEESGVFGSLFIIALYIWLLYRTCRTSNKYASRTSQLIVMGLGLMITLQALVSMAVAVGLGPVTGQPLPLISKGGTSAIITSIYFGMLMGVAREQHQLEAQELQTLSQSQETLPDDIEEDPTPPTTNDQRPTTNDPLAHSK